MSLSLGQQLTNQRAINKADQIAEKERLARETDDQKRQDYATMEAYLNDVRDKLVAQIQAGETHPKVDTPRGVMDPINILMKQIVFSEVNYVGRNKPGVCYQDSPFYPLWQAQVRWFLINDLDLKTTYERDGVGKERWFSFRLEPAQKRLKEKEERLKATPKA